MRDIPPSFWSYHDRIFSEFEDRFLKRNITADLLKQGLNPLHWPKLSSPYYGRSDLAADYYDKILFHGATFGDLGQDGGDPRLILNATDTIEVGILGAGNSTAHGMHSSILLWQPR